MTGELQFVALLAQVGTFQASRQQRHDMIPTKRLSEGRVSKDECGHLGTGGIV